MVSQTVSTHSSTMDLQFGVILTLNWAVIPAELHWVNSRTQNYLQNIVLVHHAFVSCVARTVNAGHVLQFYILMQFYIPNT